MEWDHIRLNREDGVATVTLDRPEALNAFIGSMRGDLLEAIEQAVADPGTRVLVITGAGRAFCAGGDVKFMARAVASGEPERDVAPLIEQGIRVVEALSKLPVPSLAAVNGIAAGAGLGLALACDLRLASSTARLGATFSRIGLHPDWATSYNLPRLVGPARARELVFSGRLVEADEALRLGLVNWVVPPEELTQALQSRAQELRDSATTALAQARRTLTLAETGSLEEILDEERRAQLACLRTEDAREGLKAFLEKRVPFFRGT